jgi:hypothetical protein
MEIPASMPTVYRKSICAAFSVICLIACRAFGQEESPHWGFEVNGGYLRSPTSLPEWFQDRYRASVTGVSYAVGLVRFHANGAPSFSLQFQQFRLDGRATEQRFPNRAYAGDARVPGFLATKHLNVFARSRGSAGFSLGAGVGPQFKASYRLEQPGASSGLERTYTLKELPVTPLFQILVRGDIRILRQLSVGPFFGTRNGLLVGGATTRVHFLK